jgi:hypothetical protein
MLSLCFSISKPSVFSRQLFCIILKLKIEDCGRSPNVIKLRDFFYEKIGVRGGAPKKNLSRPAAGGPLSEILLNLMALGRSSLYE